MPRSVRALTLLRTRAARSFAAAALLAVSFDSGGRSAAVAQAEDEPGTPTTAGEPVHSVGADLFAELKRFDFDERPLGNFDDTPMFWIRLSGEGLPRYSAGRFDDQFGHAAPPSFVLDLQGGNICYEYRGDDLTVQPNADYLLAGYVRAVGLRHARAFVHAYLVDPLDRPVAGSDRISNLVSSLAPDSADEPWQRLELALTNHFPAAYALHLRLWVLQANVWQVPAEPALDPIIRQDVRATVWFDDITVCRVPRLGLRLADPAGLVRPGQTARLILDVDNPAAEARVAEIAVRGAGGQERHRARQEVPGHATEPVQVLLPALEPGLYEVRLRLPDTAGAWRRSLRFAMLPELPPARPATGDFGVDLGGWTPSDVTSVVELVTELRCGAVKVGVPMLGALEGEASVAYLDQVLELVRRLAAAEIDTTGVLLAPGSGDDFGAARTTRELLVSEQNHDQRCGPVLRHLRGFVSGWQLGDERRELTGACSWDATALADACRKLEQVGMPRQLIVPCSVFDPRLGAESAAADSREPPKPGDETARRRSLVTSVWVPADLPARSLAQQLAFLGATPAGEGDDDPSQASEAVPNYWLKLDLDSSDLTGGQRLAESARRLVLAKALGGERVYVPAPFERSVSGGQAAWQPTDDYIWLRTLFHYLSGKRAVAARVFPEQDGVGLVFDGPEGPCMLAWTWRDRPADQPVELHLGPSPVAVDLWGHRSPAELKAGRAQVRLTPTPIILEPIDSALALVEGSFRIEPAFVQLHQPEPRPVLRLRNYYYDDLTGTIEFALPPDWRLEPRVVSFQLKPGESLEQTLCLELPPRELATQRRLGVRVALGAPVAEELEFAVPITVGLRDLRSEYRTRWVGDELIVEQAVQNLSERPVSFSVFCRAPRRAQAERDFLDVAPGHTEVQTYRYPAARDLAGAALRLGLREIQGPRSLDQLVEIGD